MECGNQTLLNTFQENAKKVEKADAPLSTFHEETNKTRVSSVSQSNYKQCYTAPFIRCGDDLKYTPLWNLHVHSKHTDKFRSHICLCT